MMRSSLKTKNSRSSSHLFLIEVMIAILIFALTSGVCVNIFYKAHTLSQDAARLDEAVSQCSSVAEIVRASDSLEELQGTLESEYPDVSTDITTSEGLITCHITYCQDSEVIYELTVKRNIQEVTE